MTPSYEFRSGLVNEGRGYDPAETWDERIEYMTAEEIAEDDRQRKLDEAEQKIVEPNVVERGQAILAHYFAPKGN